MKLSGKNINITSPLLLLALAAALLLTAPACIREDFPTDCAEQGKEVTLQISVGLDPLTKAPAAATGSVLTDLEKDIKSLRIYAFYNGAFAGHEYIYDGGKSLVADGKVNFYMDLTMFIIGEQKVDFYVIANEISLTGGRYETEKLSEKTTEAQLNAMYFASMVGVHPVELPNGMINVAKQSYMLVMDGKHTPTPDDTDGTKHENHSWVNKIYGFDEAGNVNKSKELTQLSFNLQRPFGKLCVYAAKAAGSAPDVSLTISAVRLLTNGTRRHNYIMPQETGTLKAMTAKYENNINLHISEESSTGGSKTVTSILGTTPSIDQYECVLLHDYYPHENAYGSSPDTWAQMAYYEPDGYENGRKKWKLSSEQPGANVADYKGNILEIDYYFGTDATAVKTGTVYLPPIERNHFYGIYCSMKNDAGISISYNVMAWDDMRPVDEDTNQQDSWKIEFNYPDYVDLYPVDVDNSDPDNPKYKYPDRPELSFVAASGNSGESTDQSDNAGNHDGCFKARFRIWGPETSRWSPILDVKNVTINGKPTTAGTNDYSYEVFEVIRNNNTEELKPVSGTSVGTDVGGTDVTTVFPESENEYEIHVKAKEDDNVGAIIKLGISFIPAWEPGSHMLLMVNGVGYKQTSWPNSGDYSEWIEITQVEKVTNQ